MSHSACLFSFFTYIFFILSYIFFILSCIMFSYFLYAYHKFVFRFYFFVDGDLAIPSSVSLFWFIITIIIFLLLSFPYLLFLPFSLFHFLLFFPFSFFLFFILFFPFSLFLCFLPFSPTFLLFCLFLSHSHFPFYLACPLETSYNSVGNNNNNKYWQKVDTKLLKKIKIKMVFM